MIKSTYFFIPVLVWGITFSVWAASPIVIANQFPLVLEVEKFALQSGRIINDRDASNGKAVLSEGLNFNAKITVTFKEAGQYRLTLFEKTTDGSKDSIHIRVNNDPDVRTYPDTAAYGAYAPCKKVAFINQNEPGDVTVTLFTTNEYGSYYDKVIIDSIK